MKVVPATILSCLIFAAPVTGAYADVKAPLAPGKPAGVRKAELLDGSNGIFLVAGAALIGITAGLASAGNGVSVNNTGTSGGGSTSTSTTGTAP
jgi:hypothetical protein